MELSPADIAALLEKLGLDPATTDVAAVLAKVEELKAAGGEVQTAQAAATDATGKLEAIQAERDKLKADFEALYQKQQDLERQQNEAAADSILEQYADRLNEKSKPRLRALLLTDREAAMDILEGLPAAAAPITGSEAAPEAPQHDPAAPVEMTTEEKAAALGALITAIRKEGKFKDYSSAREEARRRKPDLFT